MHSGWIVGVGGGWWLIVVSKRNNCSQRSRLGQWHTAVLDPVGNMWIFGGCTVEGELKNDLWRYNTGTMAGWVDIPTVDGDSWPSPRFSHMAVMHGRNMWIFGGVVQQGLSNELWALDTTTAKWTGEGRGGSGGFPFGCD